MSSYIKKLIEEGESQHLDFKFSINDSKKIARSLVAFANTDGGKLLIGVKDNGAIAGVRSDEEYHMIEAASQMYSRPEVPFTSRKWVVDGKTILEINIPKSDKKPHYAPGKNNKWLVFIRVYDENILANKVLLDVWKRENRKSGVFIKYSEKEKILLDYLEKNHQISLSKLSKIAYVSRYKAISILVDLISLGVIEMVFTEKQVYYQLKKNTEKPENVHPR